MEALSGRKRKGKKGYLFIDTTIAPTTTTSTYSVLPPLTIAPFVYHAMQHNCCCINYIHFLSRGKLLTCTQMHMTLPHYCKMGPSLFCHCLWQAKSFISLYLNIHLLTYLLGNAARLKYATCSFYSGSSTDHSSPLSISPVVIFTTHAI